MDPKKINKENNKVQVNGPTVDNFYHYYKKKQKSSAYSRKSGINYSVDANKKSIIDINILKSKISNLDLKIKSMNLPQEDKKT